MSLGVDMCGGLQRGMVDVYVRQCHQMHSLPNQAVLASLSSHARSLPSHSLPPSLSFSSPWSVSPHDVIATLDAFTEMEKALFQREGEGEGEREGEGEGEGVVGNKYGWEGESLCWDFSGIRYSSLPPLFSWASSHSVSLTSLSLSHANATDQVPFSPLSFSLSLFLCVCERVWSSSLSRVFSSSSNLLPLRISPPLWMDCLLCVLCRLSIFLTTNSQPRQLIFSRVFLTSIGIHMVFPFTISMCHIIQLGTRG